MKAYVTVLQTQSYIIDWNFKWVCKFEHVYSFLRMGSGEGDAGLFPLVSRMHGNGSTLHRRFRMDIKKHFFTEGVVKQWNRLPRKVVDALSLSVH